MIRVFLLSSICSIMVAAHPLLLAAAEDRCCAVCYYTYVKKFLGRRDRMQLWNTARDCSCDFMDGFAENFNNRQALLPEKKKSGSDGAPSTMEAAADT